MEISELKDRKEKIENLIEEMILKFNRETGATIMGIQIKPIPSQVSETIISYDVKLGIII